VRSQTGRGSQIQPWTTKFGGTVNEDHQAVRRPVGEHGPVGGDAGDAQAGGLIVQVGPAVGPYAEGYGQSGTTMYAAAVPNGG
jgi:hypothetical protein